MPPFSRGLLAGLLLPLAAGLPLAAFGLQFIPDSTFPGTVARILESAAPQLLAASLLPILALAAGLFLIQHLHTQAQIEAAAQIDVELLADDLPPEAYNDAGFVEFLKNPQD